MYAHRRYIHNGINLEVHSVCLYLPLPFTSTGYPNKVHKMTINNKPKIVDKEWNCILSSCRIYKNWALNFSSCFLWVPSYIFFLNFTSIIIFSSQVQLLGSTYLFLHANVVESPATVASGVCHLRGSLHFR